MSKFTILPLFFIFFLYKIIIESLSNIIFYAIMQIKIVQKYKIISMDALEHNSKNVCKIQPLTYYFNINVLDVVLSKLQQSNETKKHFTFDHYIFLLIMNYFYLSNNFLFKLREYLTSMVRSSLNFLVFLRSNGRHSFFFFSN